MTKIPPQAIIRHLEQKWIGRGCPMCGVQQWQIQDSTFELREFNGAGMLIGGPIIPVVPIMCANCGNTVLINAIVAGVTAREGAAKP